MKDGWDKKKGLNRVLIAKKNLEDPSSSDFTSVVVQSSSAGSFIFKGSTKLFRTEPWTDRRASGVIGLAENPLYDYEFVNNEYEPSSTRVLLVAAVGTYCGSSKRSKSHQHWEEEIEQYEVLVMTPQILLHNLSHCFLKMEMIALLIFDECHHARC
ncbi:hypothetical protein RYX36_025576 [Vicia faba]